VAIKTVAIVQSCYIPWKGYFDLIRSADEFILYDDRQFTRRDWRNRNKIKTADGVRWLTVPVHVKGRYHQRIDETVVSDASWADRHLKTLVHAYAGAPHFTEFADALEELYGRAGREPLLSRVNRLFLDWVCDVLQIGTALTWSTDYDVEGDRTGRLVSLCRAAGGTRYVSGPRARGYLDEDEFARAGIELVYADYDGYPVYEQLHPPFEHGVTILDLLFHVGSEAPSYMKSLARVA
jgi:WbqC-like protein family